MDAKQKMLLAGALVLVWAGLAVLQWSLFEEPAPVPLTNLSGPASGGRQSEGSGGGMYVNLSLLKATAMQRDTSYTTPRNIFTMTSVEGTLPPNSDASGVMSEETPSTEIVTEQEGVTGVAQFKYLGFLRMGEGAHSHPPMAVLRKDDDLFVLKAGDRIDERLVLKKITPDHVTLRDPRTQVEQTVALSDEAGDQE